jgi:hypothetical protein
MHIPGRLTSGAVRFELSASKSVQDGFGHDRPRRVPSTKEKHVQWLPATDDLHAVPPLATFRQSRCDERSAYLGFTSTTILDEKGQESARSFEIDSVDDRAALLARAHKASATEDAKVAGHSVVRYL